MAQLLLINPRKRTRKSAKRHTAAKRRHNPVTALARAPKRRRRNPIGLKRIHAIRRRRNPIAGLETGNIVNMLETAAIGGAGSVAVDVLMGQVKSMLPVSMQVVPGTVGVGDAVKMGITIASGQLLNKATKGLSGKMAAGALTVQFANIIKSFVPATMTMGGVGYSMPGRVIQGTNRVGPLMSRVGAYQAAGRTPLLGAYVRPGRSALLSGARQREGVTVR
jgi:hypothetical protein